MKSCAVFNLSHLVKKIANMHEKLLDSFAIHIPYFVKIFFSLIFSVYFILLKYNLKLEFQENFRKKETEVGENWRNFR